MDLSKNVFRWQDSTEKTYGGILSILSRIYTSFLKNQSVWICSNLEECSPIPEDGPGMSYNLTKNAGLCRYRDPVEAVLTFRFFINLVNSWFVTTILLINIFFSNETPNKLSKYNRRSLNCILFHNIKGHLLIIHTLKWETKGFFSVLY